MEAGAFPASDLPKRSTTRPQGAWLQTDYRGVAKLRTDTAPAMTRSRIAAGLAGVALALAGAADARAADTTVVEQPVSFSVKNVNRTRLACATDGRSYTVRGHLVGTADQLRANGPVTLYLHGLGLGEFFWRLQAVPGYDFAANLAARGHASVVIDRLGYGTSGKAPGKLSCIGGQADIAHQIIGRLKSGSYGGAATPRFGSVGLVGHSAGGLITQVEAYSFSDAKAIGVLAYADQGISRAQRDAGAEASRICAAGGIRAGGALLPSGPGGYALLGQTLPAAANAFFNQTSPFVANAALLRVTRNPCGDLASYLKAPATDKLELKRVRQPVLLVQAGADTLFPAPAVRRQVARFGHARSVTYRQVSGSGHAVTLETSHTQVENFVAQFLAGNGL